ncbi:MAG: pantoate--beta-alanine ligase [Desulfobacterales bacterium]
MINVIRAIADAADRSEKLRQTGRTIALIPTMGFFHQGHLELMHEGRRLADDLVVSLFVNPTQFGPNEDYATYPRNTDRDLALAEEAGVDAVFMPEADEMYPQGFQTYVDQTDLPNHLCGLSRPDHFRGVMTVVAKLFNIIRPHIAVFGEKDYQQLAVIRQMVRDLNFNIDIRGLPTVRETDGLAMSSRNTRLGAAQRKSALSLNQTLQAMQEHVRNGETRADNLIDAAAGIINAYPGTAIDYIKISDPQTLEDVQMIDRRVLMALAVKVGDVRLIDHTLLDPYA